MIDLSHFTLRDMTELGGELRRLGGDAGTLTHLAGRVVTHLHDRLRVGETGAPACPLVRFFKTHPLDGLPEPWADFARGRLPEGERSDPSVRCMTLLGTAGVRKGWCAPQRSKDHMALPLTSAAALRRIPMMAALLGAFGVRLPEAPGRRDLVVEAEQESFGVFHVPVAAGSPSLPYQDEFVLPERIASAVGVGARLTSGEIFAVLLFSRVPVSAETARLFRVLALSTKAAALPYDGAVFSRPG